MPDRIYGPYEAAVCVSPTTTGINGACTGQLKQALDAEIKKGARCELKTEHFMFQNTGRFSTLWTLTCQGYVLDTQTVAEGDPVIAPEIDATAPVEK